MEMFNWFRSRSRNCGNFAKATVVTVRTALSRAGTSALSTRGKALEIIAEFKVGTASQFGFKVRTGSGEETLVGYDAPAGQVFVDRTKSGQVAFSSLFPSRETAPLSAEDGRVKLHIFVDWSSVEVFGDDGQVCITDQIFPMPSSDGLALFAEWWDRQAGFIANLATAIDLGQAVDTVKTLLEAGSPFREPAWSVRSFAQVISNQGRGLVLASHVPRF